MFVEAMVRECDFTGNRYDTPVPGAWAVAQGATGRWCAVMYIGPEVIAEQGYQLISYDDAVARAEAEGGEVDF